MKNPTSKNHQNGIEIAIIGMAARFPGAANVKQFWRNLHDGVESLTLFSDAELRSSGVDPALIANPDYVKAKPILEDTDSFDAAFFGFNPKEAEIMDPQHRIFLECAWEALENAGYDSEKYKGLIGVYAGASMNSYLLNLVANHSSKGPPDYYQMLVGNEKDFLPTRVSYKLNLKGPSLNVQSACSTSLVAVHLACQGLLSGECDMVLAGGVSIQVPQRDGYLYQEGMIRSPDGRCRAFDARAQGTNFGEGVGVVVLKRLADAESDGDHIEAVIKGSAINNDGAYKVGYAAPSVDGQAKVIRAAQSVAEVEPDTLSYIEAHGTGTEIGDPIEIAALTKAFRASTQRKNFCAVGSVKTNFGHLDAAAGIAGLIKTALALKHKLLPASIHFERPNAKIDFDNSPFYVNAKLAQWPSGPTPRRAGVSSFGIGGTNAHVILEEGPIAEASGPARPWQLLVLSAKTTTALEAAARNLATHLRDHPDFTLADVAYTLQVGRRRFGHRRAVVCRDARNAVDMLESSDPKLVMTVHSEQEDRPVAFMFPGQGAQYVNMAVSLYREEAIFRKTVDECAQALVPHLEVDVREILFPEPAQTAAAERKITETYITQPTLFVIEYALAQLWLNWGIRPRAVIGHSLGEYVAACLAGVMTRDDALSLLAGRARLMQQLPPGGMLAVRLAAKDLKSLLDARLSIAAVNTTALTVISGPYEALECLELELAERGVGYRRLPTSHAFHSDMMNPVLEPFAKLTEKIRLRPPQIGWVSCLTGDWITESQAIDPTYWVRQLRETVRFTEGVGKLLKDHQSALLEVGPGTSLANFAKQHPDRTKEHVVLSSSSSAREAGLDIESMLHSLGGLWLAGAAVDWQQVHGGEPRRRLPLPTYPFERQRYWIDTPTTADHEPENAASAADNGDLSNHRDIEIETGVSVMKSNLAESASSGQQIELQSRLRAVLSELSGIEAAALDSSANFAELGFDSLFLTQASGAIQRSFNVKVSFLQLLEDLSTIEALAAHLDRVMPREQKAETESLIVASQPTTQKPPAEPLAAAQNLCATSNGLPTDGLGRGSDALERILNRHLDLMSRQLDLLRNGSRSIDGISFSLEEMSRVNGHSESVPVAGRAPAIPVSPAVAGRSQLLERTDSTAFGPYSAIKKHAQEALAPRQQENLDSFISRYTKRTQESKRYTQTHRAHLADPRSVAGFRSLWKELTYPIVVARSSGCKLWDLDGNEYVDLVNGFGSSLFGYAPQFVTEAIEAQLKTGMEIGPQSLLAGKVAELVCEMTGMERAAFCNTGSEAVLAALRVARTVTGRDKIALFSGSYHGIFDEVLVRSVAGGREARSMPIAPGIVESMVKNVLVLDYGNPESLRILKERCDEIAAVLVEPVQSRRPELQPTEFLHELRDLTKASGIALIFDEMITGFRSHPGGVQTLFGVKADLATYGKVIGGGLPIGVVAGTAAFMDALDGGTWSYGDASFPTVDVTFFAGTFVRHPLALAAARAVLDHLKRSGPTLQAGLNAKTAELVKSLNAYIEELGAPMRVTHFSSWLSIHFTENLPLTSLFFAFMRAKGVHLLEGRPCFLTTAHTDEDLEHVVGAFRESVSEMQEAGFLPAPQNARQQSVSRQVAEISSCKDPEYVPLSFTQQQIWFLEQLMPGSAVYNLAIGYRFKGSLSVPALEAGLNEIVRRHKSLRTTISVIDEVPVQVIAPSIKISLPTHDLTTVPQFEREARAMQIASEEARDPFNLVEGPLMRSTVLKLSENEYVLLVTCHHLITDGLSQDVFLRELAHLYGTFSTGNPSLLPEISFQYADFVRCQEEKLRGDVLEQRLLYWKSQLEGLPELLALPTDRRRPAVRTYHGATQSKVVSKELTKKLKTLSRNERVTLYMTLLAAFKVLLCRLTGQADMVVGSPIAGRDQVEVEGLIGLFVNTMILRTDLSGDPTFRELLQRVRESTLGAYRNQEVPFDKLMGELKSERHLSHNTLFQVMFVHEKADSEQSLKFPGLDFRVFVIETGTSMFDLTLSIMESPESLNCSFTYNTDLFDDTTITRIMDHFQTVLEGIVANPGERFSALPLLKQAERQRLVVQWNDTRIEYPQDKFIHQLFEEQAKRRPNGVGVLFEGQRLTYQELDLRANRLAHYLGKRGVGPEVLVGICMERSLEMIVALLGVLKAGAAYVPLDPHYPKERLAFMLEDAGASVLITRSSLVSQLPGVNVDGRPTMDKDNQHRSAAIGGPYSMVYLDTDWNAIIQESGENPAVAVDAENLAYVIYTSGSTGRPKRVGVTHRSLANYAQFASEMFEISNSDRVLQFASLSFDTSTEEIFPCLIKGATLVLRSDAMIDSAASFLRHCSEWHVNVLDLPTAYWHELTDGMVLEGLALPGCVRLVIIGGERAAPKQLMNWRHAVRDHARLLNTYGPTEATVAATVWELSVTDSEDESLREVPIGRPVANTQIYILDSHLEPVPIGVAGDLYIGGAGLARGYLNHPNQTAEKFIPNPFGERVGERLYCTGDLARYLGDGNIEFLGRSDRQVKVRGYRIELGEIEAVLGRHSQVRQAVVLLRQDAPGDHSTSVGVNKRLVAYIVAAQPPAPSTSDLRSFLQATLPDYMIPSVFVFLDSLPITSSGKVDHQMLPEPDQSGPDLEGNFITARNPVEEVLATIWANILGIGRVGIYDNFFDLGGHSLLATQVISRIRKVFGVEIPLRSLFESPSVAALAARIDEALRHQQGLQTVPILPMPREGDLELSFAQQRLWFLDRFDPHSSVYNIRSGLRLRGPLDVAALERSLNEIICRHETLRSTFKDIRGVPRQTIEQSGSLSLPVIDLSDRPEGCRESEAGRLAEEEGRLPFDLTSDLMLRGKVLRLGERDHILLLTLHHIAADGWSMGILFREISALYEAFTTGKPSSLAEVTIQYADFAHWQRQWLQGEMLQTQLSYWKAKLENLPVLDLPTDYSRPAVQGYRGASESVTISGTTVSALRELSRKEGATLFMTLLAAFKILLYRYTGQQDIVIGTPIAGRNRSEIEGLIGFFVNTLVLRTDLSGNCTFRELLGRVRETALGAYAHQDLPFEKLVEELQPERDLSRNPLFQIFFNMLHGGSSDLELSGLEIESLTSFNSESKFDLTLYVGEHDDSAHLKMVYNTDLFESDTINRLLRHYCTLLEGIAADPDRIIMHYPLLTQDERRGLATGKNAVGPANAFVEFKREEIEQSIAARFEQQATLFREKTAVKSQEQRWTYGELNRRANQIARALLQQCGAGEERVVLLFEHGAPMIAAILGVLKSAKAYVPLEPSHPTERLSYMMEDSESTVILSDRRNLELARELSRGSRAVINIEEIDPATSAENLGLTVSPEAMAYILYTSGSTGQPKGVMQNHRNVLHHARCYTNSLHIHADDRLTLFSAYSHDAAVIDIFSALLNGATLYPWKVSEQGLIGLPEWLEGQEVTVYHSTPSLYQSLLDTLDSGVRFSNVRAVVLGGEKAANRHFEGFWGHFSPHAIFCNLYGSTESSFNLLFSSGAHTPTRRNAISIGYPVQDTEVVLLNEDGTVGEIYGEIGIRSEHVALGYWHNPQLTDAVFLPDSEQETRRLYRTGDIGRLLPDGSIGFLGRRDSQVKIRGYRIELGEVEAVLTQHPTVKQAVVAIRGEANRASSTRPRFGELLVGYVVMQLGEILNADKLRDHLKQKVPEYMVPAVFVGLDTLPLMPNGKVNRRTLPLPEDQAGEIESVFVAPRTPIEDSVAEIWREVLDLERIGIMDNFFALGGHSLLALQVIYLVGKQFNIEVALRILFEKPTIEQFAGFIFDRLVRNEHGDLDSLLSEIEALSDEMAPSLVGDQ